VALPQLIGTSPALAAIRDELSRLFSRPTTTPKRLPPVLIQGETGTGKGLVAHLIHQLGPRADASFVDVNCAAIPETLFEAEIFGFERGAFTDAKQAKAGLLQVAHRGTIFLDEVGLMPEAFQAKLLKAIEERSVRRLGGTRSEAADAWVLSATSEDLTTAIRTRRFREDLYHRLAVVTVQMPPLRERGGDVLLLARHYLERACSEYGLAAKSLAADAEAALMAYPWPGNVRELANVMERVALLSDAERVSAATLRLPRVPRVAATASRAGATVDEQTASLERARIEEALRAEAWNISRAAARLGLARNTLRYRMERHGLLEPSDGRRGRADAAIGSVVPEPAAADRGEPVDTVKWQPTRITVLEIRLLESERLAEHERARILEKSAAKASAFGGRLLELAPPSVKVAFGFDRVEDAACHAAHSAFAVQRAMRGARSAPSVPLAMALHTEEMRVGRLGDRVEIDADARRAADTVLDALLAASPGDTIVASETAKAFLEHRFTVEPVAAVHETVRPWLIVGLADANQASTLFVSRTRELAVLEDLLAQAEEGRGQAVLIAGEPGIGKTRLLHELRRRTVARAAWLQGSAVSFGGSLPFHPLIDLLRNAFSLQPGDADEVVGERIDRATAAFGDAYKPSVPFLRSLLSADTGDTAQTRLDPKLRRAGIFEALGRLLHAIAETRPLIVVLEDLHWMDQATGEFLSLMSEHLLSGRILLCVTVRTGYTWPFAQVAFGTHLTLSRVSQADTTAMTRALLGAAHLSAELQHLIDRTTEGNPFFIEEMLRSLKERHLLERRGDDVRLVQSTATIDVPDRVQDVLRGRLERLDARSRDLLLVAAVIGREFPRRVLEQVVAPAAAPIDDALGALRTAELIHNARVWPEVVYAFKHALTHEVAYQAQTEPDRRAQHARIGEAIEQVYADRASHFGVLAHHFTQARRWDKALAYLQAAAQQAERTFATREALALYDEALQATGRLGGGAGDPTTLIAIHEAKARLYFVASEFEHSAAEGERILPLARLTGNRAKEAEALATIAWASTWGRNIDAALRFAGEALAVAEPAGALAVQGRANLVIGFVRGVTGALDQSRVALDKAVTISQTAGDRVNYSLSLSIAGLLRNWSGDFGEAVRLQTQALTIARERGLLVPLLFSCFMRGLTLTGKGDYDEAYAAFTEGLSLAERIGDEAIHHRLLNCLGWLYADLGDLAEAEAVNATSAQIGRRRHDPGTQPNAELNLAEIFAARGEMDRARDQYDGVFRYFKNPSTSEWMRYRYSIRMFAGMGELAVAQGDLTAARSHGAECLTLATRTGSKKNLVKARRLAGEIARAAGEADAAEGHFRAACDLAVALGNPVQQWKSELAFGRFLHASGRTDDAQQAFHRCLQVLQQVRSRLREERLREAFAKNPDFAIVQSLVASV
jgi:transcriptional regulator with AAA-type ATPase domain/tetratricopeptide (TPR) repeat protein